ncbi:unnamed protein product, partial [Rotaria socialis]
QKYFLFSIYNAHIRKSRNYFVRRLKRNTQEFTVEIFQNIDTNHRNSTNKMDVNDTDEIRSNGKSVSNLWEHMTKQENGKPQCKICNKLQSRQSGATSGLRKHLFQAHKMESFCVTSENPPSKSYQISTEEKKKIDSLTINRIVQDGRGFDDMRRPEMLKVFKHLAPAYFPPHRNTVQRRLKHLQSDHKSLLIKK